MSGTNPMSSFVVKDLIKIKVFGFDLSFTNSSLFMVISLVIICYTLHIWTKYASIVPNRYNLFVEKLFFFIGAILKPDLGSKSILFFPYVLALFLFIFVGNLIGLIPYSFCFTSQIAVTFGMAIAIFVTSIFVGLYMHGFMYFKRFVPVGVPVAIAPVLVIVEVVSFMFRPISMGVRLFANMISGHIMLDIVAGFAVSFACGNVFFRPFILFPIIINIALILMKFLVCYIQAYIFTMLCSVYIGETIKDGH